jgi:hypothetical protein
MLFLFVLCSLLCSAVEALHEQKTDEKRKTHALREGNFARLADEFGRKGNASGFAVLVWWDFTARHR